MAQNIQLKRSSLPGKVPDTGSLNLGEIAINTYDGKVFFKKSGSLESIESVITTNSINTGSITLTQTGSFGELVVTQDVNIQRDLYVTNDIVGNGDIDVLGNITGSNLLIKGTLTAQSYIVSSSVVNMTTQFASGSTIFGNSLDDTHQFTGSVNITGSGYINSNRIITDADTGSFATSGGYPESGVDYNTDSTTVADFNIESPQFLVDYLYETSVGTEVGLKGFIGNTSGSTLVVPANDFIGFVIDDVEVARVTANGFEGISLPSGLISGSSQLTSSYDTRYVISGSITQTTWDNIASKPGGIVSGSSQVTASLDTRYALSGSVVAGGGNLDSRSQMLSQSVAATTWSFNHNLGSQYPIISVYGSTGEIIQPETIKTIDEDNLEITFGTAVSGIAVASLGSLTEVTGRTIRQDFTSSVSWSFNHNLGDRYVMIQTFDTANDMMLPQSVTLTDTTSSLITFTEAVSGYALATIGGGLPSISASYEGYTLQVQSGNAVWTSVLSASVATASYVEYNNVANKPTLVSGSSQLTSSFETRGSGIYSSSAQLPSGLISGSSQLPNGLVSGSSQLTSSMLATTGSNTFRGTQTLSGSIIPATDNTYDLGSATYQWRDIYVSSGSLYVDGTKVLGSTGNELQITTDVGQSIKILEAGSDSIILQSADGDIQLKTSGGGNLLFDPTTGLIDVRGTFQIQDGYKVTSSGGNTIQFGNNIGITGSINTTGNINGVNVSTLQSTFNTFTGSSNTTLSGLNTYTSSVKNAINVIGEGTSSVTTIYGNLVVEGTTLTVSASNLAVADNMIYLNDGNEITDPDLGIAGNYNDGTYAHTGIFSDASDSHTWKVYKGYVPEPSQSIDITHGTFTLADFQAATLKGAIAATNGVVSGSSQVSFTGIVDKPTLVSGSSQVSFTGIVDKPTLVSGSSQVDVMSTTNIAKLATTGSNIFTSNQSITGSGSGLYLGGGNNRIYFSNYRALEGATDGTNLQVGEGYSKVILQSTSTQINGNVTPDTNGTRDLGSASLRWANLYTNDLHLSNEDKVGGNDVDGTTGNWTIQEGEEHLYIINNKTGKKFKFSLEEMQ